MRLQLGAFRQLVGDRLRGRYCLALANDLAFPGENANAARTVFEQALKIDPDNADALAGGAYLFERGLGTNPGTDYDAKISSAIDRAIAITHRAAKVDAQQAMQLSPPERTTGTVQKSHI